MPMRNSKTFYHSRVASTTKSAGTRSLLLVFLLWNIPFYYSDLHSFNQQILSIYYGLNAGDMALNSTARVICLTELTS